MKTAVKVLVLLIALIVAGNMFHTAQKKLREIHNTDKKEYDVIDGLTGRYAVDQYLKIKEEKDTLNLPALKTSLVMFFTQHGRYPRNLEELERSGDANPELTHDRFGNRYELKIDRNVIILSSPGKDKIKGTTDDLQYTLKM